MFFSFLFLSLLPIMQEKFCFLDKLLGLFKTYGAKTLTMDDIAKEFSISKKTLYQNYRNKEDLLMEVLEFIAEEALKEIEEVKKLYSCPLEVLLVAGARIDQLTQSEKNAFVVQLIKYYPEVYQQHQKTVSAKISETLLKNYKNGCELDLYRKEVPIEMFTKFFSILTFSIEFSPFLKNCKKTKRKFLIL